MIVSRGLVGPKAALNQRPSKGKPVNIPVPPRYLAATQAQLLTLRGRLSGVVAPSNPRRSEEFRNGENRTNVGNGLPLGGFSSSLEPVKKELRNGILGGRT